MDAYSGQFLGMDLRVYLDSSGRYRRSGQNNTPNPVCRARTDTLACTWVQAGSAIISRCALLTVPGCDPSWSSFFPSMLQKTTCLPEAGRLGTPALLPAPPEAQTAHRRISVRVRPLSQPAPRCGLAGMRLLRLHTARLLMRCPAWMLPMQRIPETAQTAKM